MFCRPHLSLPAAPTVSRTALEPVRQVEQLVRELGRVGVLQDPGQFVCNTNAEGLEDVGATFAHSLGYLGYREDNREEKSQQGHFERKGVMKSFVNVGSQHFRVKLEKRRSGKLFCCFYLVV